MNRARSDLNTNHASSGGVEDFTLGIVIINYRGGDMTLRCLESLWGQIADDSGVRVVVVDNASGDGSDDQIQDGIERNGWGGRIELVRSPVNGGFSAGNNVGIKHVRAEHYLLLNNDTLVRDEAIRSLLDAAKQHPDAGIIAPRLEWPDGTPQGSCFRFQTPRDEFFLAARTGLLDRLFRVTPGTLPVSDHPVSVPWVSFACAMIRREVIERVGGLDEGYFMYQEDVDYCRSTREAGWEILYQPAARVVHLRGGSSPVKSLTAQRKRRPRYYYASRARCLTKRYGRTGFWAGNLCWWAGRVISLGRELITNKQPHTCEREWLDIWVSGAGTPRIPEVPGFPGDPGDRDHKGERTT